MRQHRVPILTYHFFQAHQTGDELPPDLRPYALNDRTFRAHLEGLHSSGYQTISLDDYWRNEALPDHPAVITLDDGHQSCSQIALPALLHHHCTATFFVCTRYIDTPHYMTRSEIVELTRAGMEIGTHSVTHSILSTLSAAQARDELLRSKAVLEDIIQAPISHTSMPGGYFSREVLEIAAELGYRTVSVSWFGLNQPTRDHFLLRRIAVEQGASWPRLQRLLSPVSLSHQFNRLRSRLWNFRENGV